MAEQGTNCTAVCTWGHGFPLSHRDGSKWYWQKVRGDVNDWHTGRLTTSWQQVPHVSTLILKGDELKGKLCLSVRRQLSNAWCAKEWYIQEQLACKHVMKRLLRCCPRALSINRRPHIWTVVGTRASSSWTMGTEEANGSLASGEYGSRDSDSTQDLNIPAQPGFLNLSVTVFWFLSKPSRIQ